MADVDKECWCCDYEAEKLNKTEDRIDGEEQTIHLCDICYNTHLYNTVKYDIQGQKSIAMSIAYIGNMILDAVKEKSSV